MSRTAIETDPNGEQPPPEDDHAFLGHPRGLLTLSGLEVWERFSLLGMQAVLVLHFAASVSDCGLGMAAGTAASVSAAALGMPLGLIPYVAGRRHLAGRKHAAEFPLAPDGPAQGRPAPVAVVPVARARQRHPGPDREALRRRLPVCFGVDGAVAVDVGLAVIALAPWLRRTMHPVH